MSHIKSELVVKSVASVTNKVQKELEFEDPEKSVAEEIIKKNTRTKNEIAG